MNRRHDAHPPASTDRLLGEYAGKRRLLFADPGDPKLRHQRVMAAEDKNFYEHGGVDFSAWARAGLPLHPEFRTNRRPQGASTNHPAGRQETFLFSSEVSFDRKIKEACWRCGSSAPIRSDKILELYLNHI